MSYERTKLHTLVAVLVTAVVVTGSAIAVAQKSGGGVVGGDRLRPGTWNSQNSQRSSRSVGHARDYAGDIYRNSRDSKRIEPTVAKAQSEELGHNITIAKKEVAVAQKEAGSDAATLAKLKSIDQHLTTAAEHHEMLHKECCKTSIDGMVCMDCCHKILTELDKAQAEQDALIRTTEMDMQSAGGATTAQQK